MMAMAEVKNGMKVPDEDIAPGDSSDAFEDAAESVTNPSVGSSARNSGERSENGQPVGLGINGDADVNANGDDKPKMSARLSRWVSEEPMMFDAGEATPTHSRQVTAEKVPATLEPGGTEKQQEQPPVESSHLRAVSNSSIQPDNLEQQLDAQISALDSIPDDDQTPVRASHSRQVTAETAPALLAHSSDRQQYPGSPPRETALHSRQVTAETAPALVSASNSQAPEPSTFLSSIRAGLKSHSRQATKEAVPVIEPPIMEPELERSVSPSKAPSGSQSPQKTVYGLSGDLPMSSPPPPSTASRLQSLEQRHIGELRPSSTSPPPQQQQPGGLMRTASTRMGQFLGRMGTMRRPGRSPPAPVQGGRFATERRNTAQSITSLNSNGGESLATISDGPEGDGGAKANMSLQDQFQSLRKQEEHNVPGADLDFENEDNESTPVMRTVSDVGVGSPTSPSQEMSDFRTIRASSTPGRVRSPPMNPDLPPGTASGLTAGPAEEPRPVDWDLWQAVVYEGPSAMQRSSGEELSRAIASGIPAAIRGVVWQVLAESKNAELEHVYRTLKARGTGTVDGGPTEPQRPDSMSRQSSQQNNNGGNESEVTSSRASIHSEHSTPATSNLASPPPSIQADEQDLRAKLMAEKQKRKATALSKLEKAIKRDLGARTSYSKFTQAAGLQDGLFGVCKAYALFDEGVGYAQGINFVAMPLLFSMAEEEAFTLLVRLMSKYDLRSMFTGDMAGLHLRLFQFERLLEDYDPALCCHLRRKLVGPQLYATQWFLTLFAYRFPLQLVLRVYDLVFSEGLTAILKFGLVLMNHNRQTLLGMNDMSQLTNFLKEKVFDVYIDKSPTASTLLDSGFFGSVTGGADKELYRADEMVRDACEITIEEAMLAQYTIEWEESQRQAHEREAEWENLRTANTTLMAKVKALEERTQQQDTEHVSIAGELVRVKVENDTLLDENESYKMKIEELQKVVDRQGADVEANLKSEMDRILQRNGEVQSENRELQEQMEEMEHELVNVKMTHAQVSLLVDVLLCSVYGLTKCDRRSRITMR